MTLNLKTEAGRDCAMRLAERSDILIEGFRPGVMERFGLGWEAVSARAPRLIYCSISGFGRHGPWAEKAGHDLSYMGMAGLLSSEGGDGVGAMPTTVLSDINAGLCAALAIVLALQERARNGLGKFVSAPMTRALLPFALPAVAARRRQESDGDARPYWFRGGMACYGVYRTADARQIVLAAMEAKFWEAFCQAVGRPDLLEGHMEPERQPFLRSEIEHIVAAKTGEEWRQLALAHDICVSPVLDPAEAIAMAGLPGAAWVDPISDAAFEAPEQAPALGEHTQEILAGELGIDGVLLRQWREEGVI